MIYFWYEVIITTNIAEYHWRRIVDIMKITGSAIELEQEYGYHKSRIVSYNLDSDEYIITIKVERM